MAKDVSVFLNWTAEPEADERKKLGFKSLVPFAVRPFVRSSLALPCLTGCLFSWQAMVLFAGYYKRMKWQLLKNRRISWLTNITPPAHVRH